MPDATVTWRQNVAFTVGSRQRLQNALQPEGKYGMIPQHKMEEGGILTTDWITVESQGVPSKTDKWPLFHGPPLFRLT